jgi:fimbrial chaperone protein
MTINRSGKWMGGCCKAAAHSAAAVAGMLACVPAVAGSFQVNPVQLTLPADRNLTSLTVNNTDTQALAIRARTFRWTQKDGHDVYEPTNDLIVSPPIFSVPAAGTQLIRVGLRSRSGATAYRVILEEIPQPRNGTVNVALRLNLPLYLLPPAGAAKAAVRWAMWKGADGSVTVEGTNSGAQRLQVSEISAAIGNSAPVSLSKQVGVILPQSALQWNIGKRADLRPGTPVVLQIRTPGGPVQAQVVPQQR